MAVAANLVGITGIARRLVMDGVLEEQPAREAMAGATGSSSFRVEPNSHNDSWSSSPVGMCAGRFSACAHVHEACLIRRMSPWALP